jgi:hypothetical protein
MLVTSVFVEEVEKDVGGTKMHSNINNKEEEDEVDEEATPFNLNEVEEAVVASKLNLVNSLLKVNADSAIHVLILTISNAFTKHQHRSLTFVELPCMFNDLCLFILMVIK